MELRKITYQKNPKTIVEDDYDCIWILLEVDHLALSGALVEWVDWKMGGALTRFFTPSRRKGVTFIPTLKRIRSPYLAVEVGNLDWEKFFKSCQGLEWERVLLISQRPMSEREFGKVKGNEYPRTLFLVQEGGT